MTHQIRVQFLDDSIKFFGIKPNQPAGYLLQSIYNELNLIEQDYFSLKYLTSNGYYIWLDLGKTMKSQLGSNYDKQVLRLSVKFWPQNPTKILIDEHTRYLFGLQIRRDMKNSKFKISTPSETENFSKIIANFLQVEYGNYYSHSTSDPAYMTLLKSFNTDLNLNQIIAEHEDLANIDHSVCDSNILDLAASMNCYGMSKYQTAEANRYISVSSIGIILLTDQNEKKLIIDWQKLRKISFHKEYLLLKERVGETIKYRMTNRNQAKLFWKLCVETHAFFYIPTCRLKFAGMNGNTNSNNNSHLDNHSSTSNSLENSYHTGHASLKKTDSKREKSPAKFRGKHGIISKGSTFKFIGNTLQEISAEAKKRPAKPFQRRDPGSITPNGSLLRNSNRINKSQSGIVRGSVNDFNTSGVSQPAGNHHRKMQSSVDINFAEHKTKADLENIDQFEQNYKRNPSDLENISPSQYNNTQNDRNAGLKESPASGKNLNTESTFLHHSNENQEQEISDYEKMNQQVDETYENEYDIPNPIRARGASGSGTAATAGLQAEKLATEMHIQSNQTFDSSAIPVEEEPIYDVPNTISQTLDRNQKIEMQHENPEIEAKVNATNSDANKTDLENGQPHHTRHASEKSSRTHSGGKLSNASQKSDATDMTFDATTLTVDYLAENSSFFQANSQELALLTELINTEKTNIRDLSIVSLHFKIFLESCENFSFQINENNHLVVLFSIYNQFYLIHKNFLENLEKIKDNFQSQSNTLHNQLTFFINFTTLLTKFIKSYNHDYKNFITEHIKIILYQFDIDSENLLASNLHQHLQNYSKSSKICYKNFGFCLLKPLIRVLAYDRIISNLVDILSSKFLDATLVKQKILNESLMSVRSLTHTIHPILKNLYAEFLTASTSKELLNLNLKSPILKNFLLQKYGSLLKLTEHGYDQRLFFIFGDKLLYTGRGVNHETAKFYIKGEITLNENTELITKEEEPKAFRVSNLILATNSIQDRDDWVELIGSIIQKSNADKKLQENLESRHSSSEDNTNNNNGSNQPSHPVKFPRTKKQNLSLLHENLSSNEEVDVREITPSVNESNSTILHVCWHRHESITFNSYYQALSNELSGTLHRRFKKKEMGWQKLWVVYSNFTLYFFKKSHDENCIASLPIWGYQIDKVDQQESSEVDRDFVLKLVFKNHVYYFAADNLYLYERWFSVLTNS